MNKCRILHLNISTDICYNKKLYDMYNVHKMIWELWKDKKETPFIFRLENEDLYVLFNQPIDNTEVSWLKDARITEEKTINLNGIYSYEIIINPSIRCKEDKKIKALTKDDEIIKWWKKKGEKYGFKIKPEQTIVSHKEKDISRKKNITIFKVKIQGILEVTNPTLFNDQFVKGFGRAKRMGCGLMLINKKY